MHIAEGVVCVRLQGERVFDSIGPLSRVFEPWIVVHIYVSEVEGHVALENSAFAACGMNSNIVIIIVMNFPNYRLVSIR